MTFNIDDLFSKKTLVVSGESYPIVPPTEKALTAWIESGLKKFIDEKTDFEAHEILNSIYIQFQASLNFVASFGTELQKETWFELYQTYVDDESTPTHLKTLIASDLRQKTCKDPLHRALIAMEFFTEENALTFKGSTQDENADVMQELSDLLSVYPQGALMGQPLMFLYGAQHSIDEQGYRLVGTEYDAIPWEVPPSHQMITRWFKKSSGHYKWIKLMLNPQPIYDDRQIIDDFAGKLDLD